MATLSENIIEIKSIFEAIADAIREKLGPNSIGECEGPSSYADKIREIKTECPEPECPECPECPEPEVPIEVIPEVSLSVNELEINNGEGTIEVSYKNYDSIQTPKINGSLNGLKVEELEKRGDIYLYKITCDTNESEDDRTAEIIFSCVKNDKISSKTARVIQKGKTPAFRMEVEKDTYEIGSDGGNLEISVTYYYSSFMYIPECSDEGVQYKSSSSGTGVGNSSTTIYSFTIDKNDGDSRISTITFSGDGKDGSTQRLIVTIEQQGAPHEELPVSVSVTPTTWEVPAEGGSMTFAVDVENGLPIGVYNSYYKIQSFPEGIKFTLSGGREGTATVKDSNTSSESRSGKIIFLAQGNGEGNEATATITVTQLGQTVVDPTPQSSPMYYGYIPTQLIIDHGLNKTDNWFENVTEECILEAVELGKITKVDQATTMGKTSFGVVPEDTMLLIAVPSDSGLVATKYDGVGNYVAFNILPLSNGDYTTEIDGIVYTLYGEYQSSDIANNKDFKIE